MDGDRFNPSIVGPSTASIAPPMVQTEEQWLAVMKPEARRAFALLRECRPIGAEELFRAAWPGSRIPAPARGRCVLEALVAELNSRLLNQYRAVAPGTFPDTWELQIMQPAGRFVFEGRGPWWDGEAADASGEVERFPRAA